MYCCRKAHPCHIFLRSPLVLSRTRFLRIAAGIALGAIATVGARPSVLAAQVQAAVDPRAEASRLRDAGNFAGAATLLRSHLASHPDDGDALRMLAQTLYWMKDVAGARTISEQGLKTHPDDTELRVQYARMLIETGSGNRAREVLAQVGSPATGGRADALLGTLDYSEGDWASADKHVASAIASGDTDPAIRKIHTDIAVLTAPWIKIEPRYQHDDQPINRKSASAEAGWYPVPSTSFLIRGEGMQLDLGDTATRTVSQAGLEVRHYAAAARAEINAGVGGIIRSFGSSNDVIGSAGIAFRLPDHFKIGGRASRSAYLATEASLSQSVMTNTGIGYLQLDHPGGWLGEAAYQLQRFPDSNNSTIAYVWILAPVVHSAPLDLRAGYSGAIENSSESRFSLSHPSQPYLPGDARFDLSGSYQPYYTPIDLQSHSLVGEITARPSAAATFNLGGSYAFRATESAPVLLAISTAAPVTTTVQRVTYTRHFNPWNAHASFSLNASNDLGLIANAEMFRTGFYTASSASVALVYRFASRAIQKAGGY